MVISMIYINYFNEIVCDFLLIYLIMSNFAI